MLVVKECTSSILIGEMDISRLMMYGQLIEKEKKKEKKSETKGARIGNFDYSQQRSNSFSRAL